jgi:hypothetical protein
VGVDRKTWHDSSVFQHGAKYDAENPGAGTDAMILKIFFAPPKNGEIIGFSQNLHRNIGFYLIFSPPKIGEIR